MKRSRKTRRTRLQLDVAGGVIFDARFFASRHIVDSIVLSEQRPILLYLREFLHIAANSLAELHCEDDILIEDCPIEVQCAIDVAADAIQQAIKCLDSESQQDYISPLPAEARPKVPSSHPTRQQGQFLAYISEYMTRNHAGLAPTHTALQYFFNLTPPSVNSMLKRLEARGFISRVPGKARGIQLTIDPEFIPPLDRPFKSR